MEQNRINTMEELTKTIESRVLSSASKAVTIEANYFRRIAPGIDPDLVSDPRSEGFSEDIHFYDVMVQLMEDGYSVIEPYEYMISDYYHVSVKKGISVHQAEENYKRKYGALLLTA